MAVALALLTSLSYGVANFIGPRLSRELPLYSVLVPGQVAALLLSVGAIAMAGSAMPDGRSLAAAAAAGAANLWSMVALYRAATLAPFSLVAPLSASGTVIPVVVGLAGGDSLAVTTLLGIVLAIGGVVVATRRRDAAPDPESQVTRATAWALSSAAGLGVFLVLIAFASSGGVLWAVMASRAMMVVLLGVLVAAWAVTVVPPVGRLAHVAAPGVLLFAGTLAYSVATRHGSLSVVSVLGSLFPVVTLALAYVFLRERLDRVQGGGIAATLIGVVLVARQE